MQWASQWLLTIDSQDEDVRRRGYTVALMALGLMAMVVCLVPLVLRSQTISGLLVLMSGFVGLLGAFLLTRAGRVASGSAIIIAVIVVGVLGSVYLNGVINFSLFFLALALITAGLTLRPWQVWPVLAINIVGIAALLRALPPESMRDTPTQSLVIGTIIFQAIVAVMGFIGGRSMAVAMREVQRSRASLQANAAALARSNIDLEDQVAARTADLTRALEQMQQQFAEQARLLSENEQQRAIIREMSVPVIPVSATTVVIPLIGALDSGRLSELQSQTLRTVEQTGVRTLVLDITGVVIVDSQVAQGIVGVVSAARLLGAEVLLVGIRPEVAQAIVQLGLSFGGMHTFSTLEAALRQRPARLAA